MDSLLMAERVEKDYGLIPMSKEPLPARRCVTVHIRIAWYWAQIWVALIRLPHITLLDAERLWLLRRYCRNTAEVSVIAFLRRSSINSPSFNGHADYFCHDATVIIEGNAVHYADAAPSARKLLRLPCGGPGAGATGAGDRRPGSLRDAGDGGVPCASLLHQ